MVLSADYRILEIDITRLVLESVKEFGLSQKEGLRCKNFWVLGLVYWIYGRDRKETTTWLKEKFAKRPEIADANIAALNAGHVYGEAAELSDSVGLFSVDPAEMQPGLYRTVTGGEALAWGLVAGAELAGLNIYFGSYPITPASPILHSLAKLKQFGVKTFQAEDEIAAICSAIGASLCRRTGHNLFFWSGHRPERRSDRSCYFNGTTACHSQLSARWPVYGLANKNGTV